MIKKEYPLFEQLNKNASIHCASLLIVKNNHIWHRNGEDNANSRNGTITFI